VKHYTIEEENTLRKAWVITRKHGSPGARDLTENDLKKLSSSEKAVVKKAKAIRQLHKGPGANKRDAKLKEVSARKSRRRGKLP